MSLMLYVIILAAIEVLSVSVCIYLSDPKIFTSRLISAFIIIILAVSIPIIQITLYRQFTGQRNLAHGAIPIIIFVESIASVVFALVLLWQKRA